MDGLPQEKIEQKLQNAALKAALEIDVLDDPYEAIDLLIHYLKKEFDSHIFEDDLAMEVRIQELIDNQGNDGGLFGDSSE